MTVRDYWDFLEVTRDVFGLDYDDAVAFYQEMRAVLDYAPTVEDLEEYADVATDLIEPYHDVYAEDLDAEEFEDRYGEELDAGGIARPDDYDYALEDVYDLDDDVWLDDGTEIEITAEYEETT